MIFTQENTDNFLKVLTNLMSSSLMSRVISVLAFCTASSFAPRKQANILKSLALLINVRLTGPEFEILLKSYNIFYFNQNMVRQHTCFINISIYFKRQKYVS